MSTTIDCPPTPAALLEERAATACDEPSRHALRRRLVVLHLEAGDADAAARVLESLVWDGVLVWDLVDLFELVAARPRQDAVRDRLLRHYECVGSFEDGARVRKMAVLRATNPRERVRRVRELARFRMAHVRLETRPLTALLAELAFDLAGFEDALLAGYRTILAHALPHWRAARTDTAFEDAAETVGRAIDALVELHLRRGDPKRAARLLTRGARLRFDHGRKRRLLQRAALLYADRVRDDGAAMRLFKQIFDDGDDDEIARSCFDRFRALLAAGGHDARLAWLLENRGRRAARDGDSTGARSHLERAGALWERAAEPARACEAYVLGGALGSERSLEALARIHTGRKSWKDAAAALDQLSARSPSARRRHALKLAEARLALGDIEPARSAIEAVLRAEPSPEERTTARGLLLRIHRRSGAFRAVAEMLEEDAGRARGPRAAALLWEAAEVQRTELGDARAAMRLLESARRADPTNPSVHPPLAELLASHERWDVLIEVLEEHTRVHGHRRGAALVDVRIRLVEALLAGGRVEDALEQMHFAVKLDPGDAALLHVRGRLELVTGDLDAAERTLRAALVASKSPREPGGMRRRIQVYVDLSAIALARDDRARATGFAGFALELAIEQGEDPAAIEGVLRSLGEHALLARALAARCTVAKEVTDRVSALAALVETWAGPFGHDAELGKRIHGLCDAVKARVDALADDDPSLVRTAVALARTLEPVGRLEEAARLLERSWRTLGPDAPDYVEMAWDLGRLLERARRPDEARALYAAIFDALERRAPDLGALRAVSLRLEALESDRLADCLERLMTLEPESTASLAPRLVDLRAARADEPGLLRALEKAVLSAPHDRALLWRLVDAHRRVGLDSESLRPIDIALGGAPADVELRILRARVRERVGDVDGVLEDLRTALASDPRAAALAVPILGRIVNRTDGNAVSEHAIVAADLLAHLGLASEAEAALEVVLAREPANVAALQRLAAAAVLEEDWERTADLYGRLVELVELPAVDPASGGLAVAFGEACLRAGRPGDARDALERALARRPDSGAVACQLERTCEATGAWHRLSEILVARAQTLSDPTKRVRLLLRAAAVLVDEAGAHEEGRSLLEQVCAEFPESVEAALACARALVALGRAREGLALLEPALERARGGSAALRADILLEMGKAHLALEDALVAFERLQAAFSLHTRNRELATLLGVVAHDLGDQTTAERALSIVLDLAACDDGRRGELAAVDARVATRILSSIAESRASRPSSAPRRLSGIERRGRGRKVIGR